MRFLLLFLLFPLIFTEIIKLSPEEFPLLTYQYPNSVVLFYNSSSHISQRFLKEFEKTANFIEKSDHNLVFLQVDMTLSGEAPFEDLRVYPNVRIFLENKEPIEYLGMYSESDLVSFLEALLYKPPILHIDDDKSHEFSDILAKNQVSIVFFGAEKSKEAEIFNEIALVSKEHAYIFVTSAKLQAKYIFNNIAIFRQCGSQKQIESTYFNAKIELTSLKSFIDRYGIACSSLFTDKIAQRIFGTESDPFMILFLDSNYSKTTLQIYQDFAKTAHDEILLTYTPISHGLGNRMGRLVGVSKKDLPKVFILGSDPEDIVKYTMSGEITIENLKLFYHRYKNKQLIGYLRTGNVEFNASDPVPLINAKDFNLRVVQEPKDVILVFEKPMCSVCKTVREFVGKFLELNKGKVVGYRLDYLDDELFELRVGSFPGIYFFRRDDKIHPKFFIEDKKEADLFEFFKSNMMREKEQKGTRKSDEL